MNGAEEQVVFDADEDVSLTDAMATLSRLRGSLDDVRVELARTGTSMIVYTSRPESARAESAPTVPAAAPEGAGWNDLAAALEELARRSPSLWAQVHGEEARRRWPIASGDLASALAALGELRPRVAQAGVRLIGGPAELVMFEGPPAAIAPVPATTVDATWSGVLDALRSMGGSVAGLSVRLPPRGLAAHVAVPLARGAHARRRGRHARGARAPRGRGPRAAGRGGRADPPRP